MNRNVSVGCFVYGDTDGRAAFLDLPDGVVPPSRIANMIYLGTPYDLITGIVNRLHAGATKRISAQRTLAENLGIRHQQDVSRWINAQCAPRLSDDQWAKLIRLAF
jgi:hypothetical protein